VKQEALKDNESSFSGLLSLIPAKVYYGDGQTVCRILVIRFGSVTGVESEHACMQHLDQDMANEPDSWQLHGDFCGITKNTLG
jgi:hypothetical protein